MTDDDDASEQFFCWECGDAMGWRERYLQGVCDKCWDDVPDVVRAARESE